LPKPLTEDDDDDENFVFNFLVKLFLVIEEQILENISEDILTERFVLKKDEK
jgi:hypothetical protein